MLGMSNDTQQFVYRVMAVTLAIGLLSIIGIDGLAIFHFGDGEATQLIQQLNAPLVAGFSSLGLATVGHQLLGAIVSRLLGLPVPVAPLSASQGQTNMRVDNQAPMAAESRVPVARGNGADS